LILDKMTADESTSTGNQDLDHGCCRLGLLAVNQYNVAVGEEQ
jgi:hypothetical protein